MEHVAQQLIPSKNNPGEVTYLVVLQAHFGHIRVPRRIAKKTDGGCRSYGLKTAKSTGSVLTHALAFLSLIHI